MAETAIQRILLCGFMGCGKTSVGRALAFRLRWELLDTDALIQRQEGMDIPQIFARLGEEYFRQAETQIALQLTRRRQVVVSTGGGFLMREQNRQALAADPSTAIVYLECSFQTCYQRICGSDRPLVQSNTREGLQRLFEARAPVYRQAATHCVPNQGLASETVEEILRRLPIL